MKKLFILLAGLVFIWDPAVAQTGKDLQPELNQVQQKIRMLQSSDQQIKSQVATMRKDLSALEQGVTRSLTAGDSLIKAGMDSAGVANERGLKTDQEVKSLRSSLSLQQNLVIIALVLAVCLILLFLWQRKMIRSLAENHEKEMTKLQELTNSMKRDLESKVEDQRTSLFAATGKTEEKITSLGTALSKDMTGLRDSLAQSVGDLKTQSRAELETEQKKREEVFAAVNIRFASVSERIDAGLDAAVTYQKQEADHLRKELSELRKSFQEAIKAPKGRGNTAE